MSTGSTTIAAPPGCDSIKMASTGATFAARGGAIEVPDRYMGELSASNAVRNGILSAGRSYNVGTRRGRVCADGCNPTIWQAWTRECPKCNGPTIVQ